MTKPFSEILYRILADRGLTIAELSRIIDVPEGRVEQWLMGRMEPRYSSLVKICSSLGIEPNYFLGIA